MTASSTEIIEALKRDTSCTEFYSKHLSKRISVYFSAAFIRCGVQPNTITVLMLFTGVFATPLLTAGFWLPQLLGCLLLVLINVLDTSDGEVARFTGKTSIQGVLLDKVSHIITNTILFFFLWFQYFSTSGNILYLYCGLLGIIALSADELTQELAVSLSQHKGSRKQAKLALSPDGGSVIKTLYAATSSSVAFYHLYPLCILADFAFPVPIQVFSDTPLTWSLLYLSYFLFTTVLKCALRFRNAWKTL